jgi:hypothetical protein
MFNHMRSNESMAAALYFIAAVVIGSYIFLNLFLAIIMHNFETSPEQNKEGSWGTRMAIYKQKQASRWTMGCKRRPWIKEEAVVQRQMVKSFGRAVGKDQRRSAYPAAPTTPNFFGASSRRKSLFTGAAGQVGAADTASSVIMANPAAGVSMAPGSRQMLVALPTASSVAASSAFSASSNTSNVHTLVPVPTPLPTNGSVLSSPLPSAFPSALPVTPTVPRANASPFGTTMAVQKAAGKLMKRAQPTAQLKMTNQGKASGVELLLPSFSVSVLPPAATVQDSSAEGTPRFPGKLTSPPVVVMSPLPAYGRPNNSESVGMIPRAATPASQGLATPQTTQLSSVPSESKMLRVKVTARGEVNVRMVTPEEAEEEEREKREREEKRRLVRLAKQDTLGYKITQTLHRTFTTWPGSPRPVHPAHRAASNSQSVEGMSESEAGKYEPSSPSAPSARKIMRTDSGASTTSGSGDAVVVKSPLAQASTRRLALLRMGSRLLGRRAQPKKEVPKAQVSAPQVLQKELFHIPWALRVRRDLVRRAGYRGILSSGPKMAALANRGFFSARKLHSLGFLAPDNMFRMTMAWVLTHPWFERLTLAIIFWSSINLALDEPRIPKCGPQGDNTCTMLANYLQMSDMIIAAFFTVEMIMKVVGFGFFSHSHSYLRNGWNFLDFCIVVISITTLSVRDGGVKALRSLRAVRAVRPLRVIAKFPGLKLVVNSLILALPRVVEVSLVLLLFMFLMAVIGVQNFRGGFSSCNDPDPTVQTQATCVGIMTITGDQCAMLPTDALEDSCRSSLSGARFPRIWSPHPKNFDDIGHGMLTMFDLLSGEDWPGTMNLATDVRRPAKRGRDVNPQAALFFIASEVLLNAFLLDLFAGIVVSTYDYLRKKSQGSGMLTPAQKAWIESIRISLAIKPRKMKAPPSSSFGWWSSLRRSIFDIVTLRVFDQVMIGLIVTNVLFMALKKYPMSSRWVSTIEMANMVFGYIYIAEAVIKLLGLGIAQYFRSHWNKVDFFLVICSALGLIFNSGGVGTFFRIIRIFRLFRLVRLSKKMQRMARTLVLAFPALFNVGSMMLLAYYVGSIVAMNLFSDVRKSFNFRSQSEGYLNEDANFESFFRSFITLFRCSTGENFNGIMRDLMIKPPYCDDDGFQDDNSPANCGTLIIPPIFFVIFYVITNFILTKMFIAVILDAFVTEEEDDSNQQAFKLTDEHIESFRRAWALFDPAASMYISYDNLLRLVLALEAPLGLRGALGIPLSELKHEKRVLEKARRFVGNLSLCPDEFNCFQFHTVLQSLTARASNDISVQLHTMEITGAHSATGTTLKQIRSAIKIQAAFRAYRARKFFGKRGHGLGVVLGSGFSSIAHALGSSRRSVATTAHHLMSVVKGGAAKLSHVHISLSRHGADSEHAEIGEVSNSHEDAHSISEPQSERSRLSGLATAFPDAAPEGSAIVVIPSSDQRD